MLCSDCLEFHDKKVTVVFDPKQMGEVCPRCERVYSALNPNPRALHYASRKACLRRIDSDKKRKQAFSVSTAALVKRICQEN